jgi:nucleoside phosphorylase
VGTANDGTQKIIVRGDRVSASATLLDRFRSVSFNWTGQINRGRTGKQKTRVFFGTILSGEKLIDNMAFRDQLLELEPEAIGGEMEGTGLYTAAHRAKVDWILVKAICDWADGNKAGNRTSTIIAENGNKVIKKTSTKERDQKRAAQNAARFVLHMLLMTRLN